MKWSLIANPSAGRGSIRAMVEQCVTRAHAADIHLDVRWTRAAGEATRLTDEAIAGGAAGLIIAGGDGTISEVLQARLSRDIPLGLLPCGSGNDLSRALGIPRGLRALDVILAGHTRLLDLGQCGRRRFATVAACGIDAQVSEAKLSGDVSLPGTTGYLWAGLRALLHYQPGPIRLEGTFGRFEGPVWLVATANTSCYGGGIRIAPSAIADDGAFDVVIVDGHLSRLAALTLLPKALFGRHLQHPAVRTERTPWLRIEPIDGRRQVLHADGERLGFTPATLVLQPQALRIFAPAPPTPHTPASV